MPDYVFFPLVAALAAAMVYAAVAPGAQQRAEAMAEIGNPENGLTLSGELLGQMVVSEGLSMDLVQLRDGRTAARMTAFVRPGELPSAGVFYALQPVFQSAYAGQEVRVTVTARSARENGSPAMQLGYFGQGGRDRAGWARFEISREFETYSAVFPAPFADDSGAQDYIGVWPDPDGAGRSVEVLSLSARLSTHPPILRR